MGDRDRAERVFLLGTILILGYLSFLLFRPFLDWIIFGFLFAYLFYRPYLHTVRVVRKPGIAAALVLSLILLIFFVPFAIIIALLFQDVTQLGQMLASVDMNAVIASTLSSIASFFGTTFDSQTIAAATDTITRSVRARATSFAASFAGNLLRFTATLLIAFFVFGFTVFYGLVDGKRIVQAVLWATPLHRVEKNNLVREVRSVVDAVIIGHVLISFIQGIIGGIGFFLFGVPNAILWGFVMLIAALIPLIGPFIVWVPIGLYLLLTDGDVNGVVTNSRTVAALGVLLVIGPLTSMVDNVVRPKLTTKLTAEGTEVHPFTVLVGALGGLLVFGFTGLVTGPLILSLFIAVVRVYRQHWSDEDEDRHQPHTPPAPPPIESEPLPPALRRTRGASAGEKKKSGAATKGKRRG